MSALNKFIKTENKWAKLFDGKDLVRPTTAEECVPFFNKLEAELSPEILHCDGEITNAQAKRKLNHFMKVWAELEKIAGQGHEVFGVWREYYT